MLFIYKKEKDSIYGNSFEEFRPINIQSVLVKLLEKIIQNRILAEKIDNKLNVN